MCSMISAQCDNLRVMARLVREYDAKEVSRELRDAADTIWQLRNDCVDLRIENRKLRELVRDMFEKIEDSDFDPYVERQGKRGPYYEEDPSWRVKIMEH